MDTNLICFVSKQVVENDYQINRFFRLKYADESISGWFFLFGEEEDSIFESIENFEVEKLSAVILNKPFIREYIAKPFGSDFLVDKEKERVIDISQKHSFSFDRKIFAPNAGNIILEPFVWLKYHPTKLISPLLICVFLFFALFHHWAWILLSIYFLTFFIADWVRTYEHFKFGESLPAIVISVKPTLIAVKATFYSDTETKDFVKIVRVKLKNINGKQIKVGDRIGTVNLFSDKIWISRKFDFQSFPIYYATSDFEKLDSVLKKYHKTEWEELENAILQLKKPYRKKTHEVSVKSDES